MKVVLYLFTRVFDIICSKTVSLLLVCSICEKISPSPALKKFAQQCFRQELAKASWVIGRG